MAQTVNPPPRGTTATLELTHKGNINDKIQRWDYYGRGLIWFRGSFSKRESAFVQNLHRDFFFEGDAIQAVSCSAKEDTMGFIATALQMVLVSCLHLPNSICSSHSASSSSNLAFLSPALPVLRHGRTKYHGSFSRTLMQASSGQQERDGDEEPQLYYRYFSRISLNALSTC